MTPPDKTLKERTLAEWFIKTRTEFPKWKQFIWKLFGVKREGCAGGYKVTMYYFNGIYFVAKTELEGE